MYKLKTTKMAWLVVWADKKLKKMEQTAISLIKEFL